MSLDNKRRVVIILPTLNEENGIAHILQELAQVMRGLDYSCVVVDGHSTDNTVEVAHKNGAQVIQQYGKGYGDALMTGFRYARKHYRPDMVVMMDGDGTYDPSDLPNFIESLSKGDVDLVLGNRFASIEPGSMSLTNRVGNRFLSWVIRQLVDVKVVDSQCGMRAFRGPLIDIFLGANVGMPFATEMLVRAKEAEARILEVPIRYRPRVGKAKLRPFRDGFRIGSTIVRLTRDVRPLTLFGSAAVIFGIAGLYLGLDVVVEWLETGIIKRVARTILSMLLLAISVQLFFFGALADMIKLLRKPRVVQDLEYSQE